MKKTILLMIIVFMTGWLFSSAYSFISETNDTQLLGNSFAKNNINEKAEEVITFFDNPKERSSPFDRIKEEQIHVYNNRIIIDIENAEWSTLADTNSMDPLFDIGANTIRIKPESFEQIFLGDIISYESEYVDGIIIHRIVEMGEDEEGWFCKAKGDNNQFMDPGKIRFNQILGVLVGVLY